MDARELALNIAVNLGRLGRWAYEGRLNRLNQFLEETEEYVNWLEKAPKSFSFQKTFDIFKKNFNELKTGNKTDPAWAEMMFTWANILAHRARLA
ncbi:MAG: hypothetical protein ABH882_01585 [Candidatus Omnitrophota bacterium]|nr:hypothetical protein [Candidatus Omnitrophota bacterium]MBU1929349.1 hypothetical protein [Candidatus Omnitrophota bacterium]MBU2035641.1 hypothetical protein [Candidatus Omnitrophota bacterium]MBU2257798.1 hypothetical protein [Candidatus Omnitrophota bacterium]